MKDAPAADTIRALAEDASTEELPAIAGALAAALASVLARSEKVSPALKGSVELLDVTAAAEWLGAAPTWLYRHAAKLPFTRKLSHKPLRFDARALDPLGSGLRMPHRAAVGRFFATVSERTITVLAQSADHTRKGAPHGAP